MPSVAIANYDQGKALFIKGFELREIAQQIGVSLTALRKYAQRHNWASLRRETQEIVSQAVSESVVLDAKGHVNSVISSLGRYLNSLEKRDPDKMDIETFDAATRVLERLHNIGRKAHGLDAEQAGKAGSVQIVIANMTPTQLKTIQDSVIDIENTSSASASDSTSSDDTDSTS